ncbi:sugar phosphate isomerase/epimerase [Algoriphagus aestuariicola]|uniref:Sugar phosphate isomerase/epimerase n=1 Tax=Algoriphagus aestuariicola TaxID=1852016 RepID=A0ABS3BK52_9BACT|nr:sugar phosphate isomerase/epimerase family protein [Algoriphagus aestuariicola]MBN7799357.1 sugar phosphate isomerase/epimerase [Algoriphagus aestuariicola]
MNKIGFNVLAWSAEMSEALLPILDRLKKIGYDGAEFFVGGSPEESFKLVGKHCADIGLEVTTVTVLGPDENPISPNAHVREKSKERLRWVLDRAADLNSQVLCGPFHSAFATFASRAPIEDEYNWSAEVLHEMGDYAQKLGILLTPEALNRFECYLANTMEQLDYLLAKVNHPNVQAMFDTHHANMEEKKLGAAIELIAPRLGHFHISENDRGTPGSGHVNFDETFAALKKVDYSGWLTIEGFTRNDPAFANSIGVWRNFSEPWDMAENGYKLIRGMLDKHGF